jgi:hypothetical protein
MSKNSREGQVIETMHSKAYELAQISECSTWGNLSALSAADPGYLKALAQWHDSIQAMSLAMERMLAHRSSKARESVTGAEPGAPSGSMRQSC